MKKFNNRENEHVHLSDGREVWLSRASTVVAQVCLYKAEEQKWYVLLDQRGPGTPDCRGMWNFPCGYLDWDETLTQGMLREVWEECGLYLPELGAHPQFIYSPNPCVHPANNPHEEPWSISDTPLNKQNISFHYAVFFAWRGDDFPALSAENCEPGEVSDIRWMTFEEASQLELAFNHNSRLTMMLDQCAETLRLVEQKVR